MNNNEKFETLKKKINDLKIRKLASESEAKRLSDELEKSKAEIKQVYGVEIEDFANAIETMKIEYDNKLNELEQLVSKAEEKIGDVVK